MTSLSLTQELGLEIEDNITTRRSAGNKKSKMATSKRDDVGRCDLEINGSLFIDSILSQDETSDVISMFDLADELKGGMGLLGFCASTQMTRASNDCDPLPPTLSPIGHARRQNDQEQSPTWRGHTSSNMESGNLENVKNKINSEGIGNVGSVSTSKSTGRKGTLPSHADGVSDGGNVIIIDNVSYAGISDGVVEIGNGMNVSKEEGVNDLAGVDKHDLLCHADTAGAEGGGDDCGQTDADGSKEEDDDGANHEDGSNNEDGEREGLDSEDGEVHSAKGGAKGESEAGDGEIEEDEPMMGHAEGKQAGNTGVKDLAEQLSMMTNLLSRLDTRSANMNTHVKSLETSLEFSQHEIDVLKKENTKLKERLDALDTEDKRTQFQVKAVDERMEKLETIAKKKNLVFEGVPEAEGKKEDVQKTVCEVLDQLGINRPINFEACYRVGPYNKMRPRPIVVSFEKQGARDAVYARRVELRHSNTFQKVWINEDVGPASKRKQGLIRLITREAQLQGIDHRTGKYAIHINRVKYDDTNWGELPPRLQPTSLKQVRIDVDTIAYQSEFAPFSNFFPCDVKFGKHTFFCLEQAYQFVKAKTLNRPLAATRIFLSRDVHLIKQIGEELGTSEQWEKRKLDVMYVCLMSKFEQHDDLRNLLLDTGNIKLVEATPDREWGCGATLSSNVLRKHDWPGKNKHGETLMTVREELRNRIKN